MIIDVDQYRCSRSYIYTVDIKNNTPVFLSMIDTLDQWFPTYGS